MIRTGFPKAFSKSKPSQPLTQIERLGRDPAADDHPGVPDRDGIIVVGAHELAHSFRHLGSRHLRPRHEFLRGASVADAQLHMGATYVEDEDAAGGAAGAPSGSRRHLSGPMPRAYTRRASALRAVTDYLPRVPTRLPPPRGVPLCECRYAQRSCSACRQPERCRARRQCVRALALCAG